MYCYEMYEFLFSRDIMTRMQLFVDFIIFFCHKLVCYFENIFTAVTSIFYFQMIIFTKEHLTILIEYKIWNNIQYLSLES